MAEEFYISENPLAGGKASASEGGRYNGVEFGVG